jgi:hypothetical protein
VAPAVAPNVAEATAIADRANTKAAQLSSEFDIQADALASDLRTPDALSNDILMGKGQDWEGTNASAFFLSPDMAELAKKSNAEQYFTGDGPSSMAGVYEREGRKQNIAMQNRLSAMGKGNSGAAIRGGAELDAELSAKQALQMQGAAKDADASFFARQKQRGENAAEISSATSFQSQGASNLRKREMEEKERGLEVQAAKSKYFADSNEDMLSGESGGFKLVEGVKSGNIEEIRRATESITGVMSSEFGRMSEADKSAVVSEIEASLVKGGMPAAQAKANAATIFSSLAAGASIVGSLKK